MSKMSKCMMFERKVCAHKNKINKKTLNGKALTHPTDSSGLYNGGEQHQSQ